jgi:hypothetical protein
MNDPDDFPVSPDELKTRFGCGAVLGVFVAICVVVGFSLTSSASWIIVFLLAVFLCGFLALKFGDRFWEKLVELLRWL